MKPVALVAFLLFFLAVGVAVDAVRRLRRRIELDEAENTLRNEIDRLERER
jgi:hypothetical protein